MASRTVRVHLHNESGEFLTKVSDEVVGGEWGAWRPPDRIEPDDVVVVGSDSDGIATGTEARATYRFGNDDTRTLWMHWDKPFVGSATLQTTADDDHYAFVTASDGPDVVANLVVRAAGAVETDFVPSLDAFRFDNRWPDPTPYSLPPLRGTALDVKFGNAKNGLCGGMVLTALDYFIAGQRIPQQTQPPAGDSDPFFLYLVDRLFATFSPANVSLWYKLMEPLYPDTDSGFQSTLGLAVGRAAIMAREEWPLIRSDIDRGVPSPMWVQTVKSAWPGDLGLTHQILAYAYEAHGHDITLRVYDPNQPGSQPGADDVTLRFTDGDVSQRIVVTHNLSLPDDPPVYCFTRLAYTPRTPPIPGEPRLPSGVVRRRGVSLVAAAPTTVSDSVVATGKAMYDVWPNCGEHEFAWELHQETVEIAVRAFPRGYYHPVLAWSVHGQTVPADGTQRELTIMNPLPSSSGIGDPVPGFPDTPSGPVVVTVIATPDRLQLVNRPEDADYDLRVSVSCTEAGEMPPESKTGATVVEVVGLVKEVPGLAAANGDCMRKYLQSFQEAPPDIAAVIAALRAQLHRPPDPLWDPDPTMTDLTAVVGQEDPGLVEVTGWQAAAEVPMDVSVELQTAIAAAAAAPTATDVPTGHFAGTGVEIPKGIHELTGTELAESLQEQLQHEIGGATGFTH